MDVNSVVAQAPELRQLPKKSVWGEIKEEEKGEKALPPPVGHSRSERNLLTNSRATGRRSLSARVRIVLKTKQKGKEERKRAV